VYGYFILCDKGGEAETACRADRRLGDGCAIIRSTSLARLLELDL
jgi:hypothetical protein